MSQGKSRTIDTITGMRLKVIEPSREDIMKMAREIDLEKAYPRTAEEMQDALKMQSGAFVNNVVREARLWQDIDPVWDEKPVMLIEANNTNDIIKLALAQAKDDDKWEHRVTFPNGIKMYILNN